MWQCNDKLRKLKKMKQLKQSLLFVYKGMEQTTFPHLMNADEVRGDNQTGITKGISLTEGFTLICQVVPSPLWLVGSTHQRMPTKKWPSSEDLLLPQTPSIPHLTLPALCPSPIPPFLLPAPTPRPLPPLSPRSRSLPVASRLAVTHLAPPEAHNRRLVCEEGQEFRLGWGSIPPSAQRRPALRVYNYLPLAFSTGSSTVQALAPAWGDALGYTLGD